MSASRWAILAFLLAATLAWLPYDSYTGIYETRPGGAVPAGEVQAGFALSQVVHPPATAHGVGDARLPCFGIKFATYARRNRGVLRVDWLQGKRRQSWPVAVGQLGDNAYRYFCPDGEFEADRPFRVEIHGVEGKPGRSATFWLVGDSRFGTAEMPPGQGPEGKSIALQGARKQSVGPTGILRIDRGAWVFGWLCTLAIGIVALYVGLAGAEERPRA